MKKSDLKVFIKTCSVCLLPVLLGISLWDKLPDSIAIHFDIYGKPDNYASKEFVVYGLPAIMVALQAVCCFANNINIRKYDGVKKMETISKWIIPFVTVILYVATLGYALGWNVDIRKVACFVVGILFVVTGNYMPKINKLNHVKLSAEKARKVNRLIGYETVILGLMFLFSIFLPPIFSLICLGVLIVVFPISVILAILISKKT